MDINKNISAQMASILPEGENKELLSEFEKLNRYKQLYLFHKGTDTKSLSKLKEAEKKILNLKEISLITKSRIQNEFENRYFYILNDIDKAKLANLDIGSELKKIHENIINSPFSFFLDKNDPLNIFKKSKQQYKRYTKIGNEGYITALSINGDINTIEEYKQLYDRIKALEKEYKDLETFSLIYYFVENSQKIKNDTNNIIYLALSVLALLYLVILRDIRLLLNTSATLASSVIFALIAGSFIFEQISIFALIFAISISTVAIDYMFHNYMHRVYSQKRFFNKEVFYGMATTAGAFLIISFTPFNLIKQISLLALFSLVFSYLQFTFSYPLLGLKEPKDIFKIKLPKFSINKTAVTLFSFTLMALCFYNLKLDTDIKNLDVNNKELQNIDNFFNKHINRDKKTAVLVTGKNMEILLENIHLLKNKYPNIISPLSFLPSKKQFVQKKELLEKYGLENINSALNKRSLETGFREGTFKNSYDPGSLTIPEYNYETLKELPLSKYKELYISYILVPQDHHEKIIKESFVKTLSLKKLFEKEIQNSFSSLLWLGLAVFAFIVLMLYLSVKNNFLKALNFILFPVSIAFTLVFFYPLNILHLFMIVVLISLSIDYGIYINSPKSDDQTYKAVGYSLLSTFAGFGVLVFSDINALYSIGLTATAGIISILILLLIQRGYNDPSRA